MKARKIRGILLGAACTAMLVFSLTGCGKEEAQQEQQTEETEEAEEGTEEEGRGTVINIHTSGNELTERVIQLYPAYTDLGNGEGAIGDVKVKWIITPNDGNAYQTALDEKLSNIETTAPEDRIDLFTIEADYAKKYALTANLMTMEEIGITEEDLANQYAYTKEIAQNANGEICASAWQATPGFFLYRRSIAKEVFGTDEPEEVQKLLSTWEQFDDAAAKLKDNGYMMFSAYTDSYYPFNANKSQPWVDEDLTIHMDDHVMQWVEQTREYTEKGYNHQNVEISDIILDLRKDGKVFGAFAAPWYMDYVQFSCLDDPNAPLELGNGSYADWAACTGPESYYWGGTWLCVPEGCDNVEEVRDLIYALTCDEATMKKLAEENGEFVNNEKVMKELASSDYQCGFLGGQNHISFLEEAAGDIDMSNQTMYDQGVGDACKQAFRDYFDGYISVDDAMEAFYKAAIVKHPELKQPE